MKQWKKPRITTLTEKELKKIIVANASGGGFGVFTQIKG